MKNKTKTYVLLGAVAIIWGLVIYRVVDWGANDSQSIPEFATSSNLNLDKIKPKDTFSISFYERDPFLGTIQSKKKKTRKATKSAVPAVEWPPILYKGLVSGSGTSNNIFIVEMNQNQYLLKKGVKEADIKVISGNKSKIIVQYKGKRKTIKLAN